MGLESYDGLQIHVKENSIRNPFHKDDKSFPPRAHQVFGYVHDEEFNDVIAGAAY